MKLEFAFLNNDQAMTTSATSECKPGHGWGDDAGHCGPPGQNKK